MVSYQFPPAGGIASVRAMKFASYLPEFGWESFVLAPRSIPHPGDPSLHFPEERVTRTGNVVLRRFARAPSDPSSSTVATESRGASARAALFRWVLRPDGQVGWYPFAVSVGRRALREARFDVLFSSSPPLTAHAVARRLHRDTGVPWVAEFRDLWTGWGSDLPGWRHSEKMERQVAGEASVVVTASVTFSEIMASSGARRVHTVTNGFDPADFGPPSPVRRTTVSYLGTYYPDCQDLGTAFSALGSLVRRGRVKDLRVRFIGDLPPSLRVNAASAGLMEMVEATGFVPHRTCLASLQDSSLLLLAAPLPSPHPARRGHVPGKAFEYLGSGRPILVVGTAHSDVARLLSPFAHVGVVESGDVNGAERAIERLLQGVPSPPTSDLAPFTRRALAGQLAGILDQAREVGRAGRWPSPSGRSAHG
jgi:glycosyltransferase involved in cell wall biosynthesis